MILIGVRYTQKECQEVFTYIRMSVDKQLQHFNYIHSYIYKYINRYIYNLDTFYANIPFYGGQLNVPANHRMIYAGNTNYKTFCLIDLVRHPVCH